MFRLPVLMIDIPALDRLLDYLEGKQQADIDSATAQLSALAQRLQTTNTRLETATKEK